METIVHRLTRHLSARSPEWHFPHDRQSYSLQSLHGWGLGCAARLRDQGVTAGTTVGLALNNGPTYVALLLGLWQLNAIAVPLRPYAGKGFGYGGYLRDVDAVCDLHCLVRDELTDGTPFDEWAGATGKRALRESQFAAAGAAETAAGTVRSRPADIAVLQMTSGTTSRPKAVVVTHDMIMSQLAYLSDSGRLYAGTSVASAASWLPMNHDMGLFTGVLWPLYDGSHNLLAPPAFYMRNPRRWLGLLSEAGTTMNFATNTSAVAACNAVARSRDLSGIDLSRLHLYFGAEKLNADVLRRTIATMAPLGLEPEHIHVGYGMAENALAATRSPRGKPRELQAYLDHGHRVIPMLGDEPSEKLHALVSVGEAMPGYRIEIRDPQGHELPDLRIGEVHLAGPCLTPGYYRDPQQTRMSFKDGRLRTGDLGFLYDGELYFVGRQDDVVNIGGRKLIPDDIEHSVEALSFVGTGRACLLGIENDDSGLMAPLLLVEAGAIRDSATIQRRAAEIRAALLDRHDLLVGDVVLCDKGTIEKTSSGKKRRRVIRQRYLEGGIKRADQRQSLGSLPRELQA
jgi:acyl-CoA synthetase (AMP-forming)/AMP-acid ligase II